MKRCFHRIVGAMILVLIIVGARSVVAAENVFDNELHATVLSDENNTDRNFDQDVQVPTEADHTVKPKDGESINEDLKSVVPDEMVSSTTQTDAIDDSTTPSITDAVTTVAEISEPSTEEKKVDLSSDSNEVIPTTQVVEEAKIEVADKVEAPVVNGTDSLIDASVTEVMSERSLPPTSRSEKKPFRVTFIKQIPEKIFINETVSFLTYCINPQGLEEDYRFEYRILEMNGTEYVIADGNSAEVSHKFSTPGTYFLKLKMTDGTGQVATYNKRIDVKSKDLSITAVTHAPDPIYATRRVTFSSYCRNPAGAAENFRFQYNILEMNGKEYTIADGRGSLIHYVFECPGTYFLKFKMIDGIGNIATYNKKLQVDLLPLTIYKVTSDPDEVLVNDTVQFSGYIQNPLGDKKDYRFEYFLIGSDG
ncbi:MAG TPA: hypothetical protein GX717_04045 [Clostridiaceae bacterium]|nr:hypothetical protein [Clostridiaceae bacterium]